MARDITVRFKGDSSDLDADARRAAAAMDKFGDAQKRATGTASGAEGKVGGLKGALSGLGGVAKIAAGNLVANLAGTALSAVTDFVGGSVEAASRMQQASGAVDAVFGPAAKSVEHYASTSADRLGLAGAEYKELASITGAQLKSTGQSTDQAAKSTDGLITKAADLAATFGGSTKDAMEAIGSLMRGEADPIERYGISIKQSDINARLAALGQDKLTGAARKTAEAQARLTMLTDQSKDATGAFARENDTLAGKQQRAAAAMEDAKAKLGEALLPAMTAVSGFMADTLIPAITKLAEAIGPLITAIGERLGPAFTAMMGYVKPVIDALIALWQRFGGILTTMLVDKIMGIVSIIQGVFNIIRGILNVFVGLFTGDWSRAWEGVRTIFTGVWQMIVGMFKQIWPVIVGIAKIGWAAVGGVIKTGVDVVLRFFRELPGKVWSAMASLVERVKSIAVAAAHALVQAVVDGIVQAVNRARELPGKVWSAMIGVVDRVRSIATSAARGLAQAIADGVTEAVNRARELPGRIWSAVGDLYDKAWHIGEGFVRGIGNGIGAMLGWLVAQAKSVAAAPVNAVKSILHIGSPSKVMHGLGRDTMQGFADGMEAQTRKVTAVVANPLGAAIGPAAWSLPTAAPVTAPAAAGGAGAVNITVNVPPTSDPAGVGKTIVDLLKAYERTNGTLWRTVGAK